jgi:hypothetical protein
MTRDEAIRRAKSQVAQWVQSGEDPTAWEDDMLMQSEILDAMDEAKAALAAEKAARERAERENAKLRAAWPEVYHRSNLLEEMDSGKWMLYGDADMVVYPTRDAAISAAATLDAPATGE